MATNEQTSIRIVKTIAQARLARASIEVPPTAEIHAALAAAFGSSGATAANESELASAALDVLREDSAYAEPIQVMSSQVDAPASPQQFVEPLTIALTTAALLVLQTRVKFKTDHTGKWSVEVDKKSSGDSAVKLLVERLLPFLTK